MELCQRGKIGAFEKVPWSRTITDVRLDSAEQYLRRSAGGVRAPLEIFEDLVRPAGSFPVDETGNELCRSHKNV